VDAHGGAIDVVVVTLCPPQHQDVTELLQVEQGGAVSRRDVQLGGAAVGVRG
jgi:hypothetical protein